MSGEGRSGLIPQVVADAHPAPLRLAVKGLALFLLLFAALGCFWLFGNGFSTLSAHSAILPLVGAVAVVGGRGRKRKQDRGLPSESALLDLARTYLETQRRLWPRFVKTAELPEINDGMLQSMADEFRSRFLAETGELPLPSETGATPRGDAAIYIRFSSDQFRIWHHDLRPVN